MKNWVKNLDSWDFIVGKRNNLHLTKTRKKIFFINCFLLSLSYLLNSHKYWSEYLQHLFTIPKYRAGQTRTFSRLRASDARAFCWRDEQRRYSDEKDATTKDATVTHNLLPLRHWRSDANDAVRLWIWHT